MGHGYCKVIYISLHFFLTAAMKHLNLNISRSFKCTDRRFYIKPYSYSSYVTATKSIRCEWGGRYAVLPSGFECRVQFCDNIASAPAASNLDYTWDFATDGLPEVNTDVVYPCQAGHALESDVLEVGGVSAGF